MTDRRGARKDYKARRKRARRLRIRRDRKVTEEHGEPAHRSCGRKLRYPDEETALDRATQYMLSGAPKLRAYHCRYCDGWHLTKTEKW